MTGLLVIKVKNDPIVVIIQVASEVAADKMEDKSAVPDPPPEREKNGK